MTTRLLLLTAATVLAQSVLFAQIETPSGSERRSLMGIVLEEPSPGEDFRLVGQVVPKSPAGRAGITQGDYILTVDGQSTGGLQTVRELRNLLRGEPGASVWLEVRKARLGRVDMVAITRDDFDVVIPWGK